MKRKRESGNEPRTGLKFRKTANTSDHSSEYFYDQGRASGGKLSHQVKYGANSGFSPQEKGDLHTHYNEKKVTSRYTQYNANRQKYVNSARANGRGFTAQESDIDQNIAPGKTSINHIIASGTGQHAFNRTSLEFMRGGAKAGDQQLNSRQQFSGIAEQAAAMGRMRGLGRNILKEETKKEGYGKQVNTALMSEKNAFLVKRNMMAKDIHHAFESGSVNSYKSFMKNTFDSTGNLRLGHGSGNGRVSTGFDMPLNTRDQPTQRGTRLLNAYKTFGYDDMQQDNKIGKRNQSGIFTQNLRGSKLSSSHQVANDTMNRKNRFQS
jgi:hypothetical protein